jgi:uncharacterized protein
MLNGSNNHRLYTLNTEEGILGVIPTLNKILLFDRNRHLPEYVSSEVIIPENKKIINNPTIFFLLTNNCNLSCKYCYEFTSKRGSKVISYEVIKVALKYVFEKAQAEHSEFVKVILFGGEPTLAWSSIEDVVCLSKDFQEFYEISVKISLITNGCFDSKIIDYLSMNINNITFSIDGPPEIQNSQRPFKNGSHSFDIVSRNINKAIEKKLNIALRITVTQDSIQSMSKIAEFLAENFPLTSQFYEPIMQCDRYNFGIKFKDYAKNFLLAMDVCHSKGVKIGTSFFSLTPALSFCNMSNRIVVFPNGIVTGCHRVNEENQNDPVLKTFQYGKISNGIFKKTEVGFNNAAQLSLKSTAGEVCGDCFVKYYCRGGCPALKISLNRHPLSDKLPWCDVIRSTYKEIFLKKLLKKN